MCDVLEIGWLSFDFLPAVIMVATDVSADVE